MPQSLPLGSDSGSLKSGFLDSGPPELLGWKPEFVALDDLGNIFGFAAGWRNFGLGLIFKRTSPDIFIR
jgi:hypothetical protein